MCKYSYLPTYLRQLHNKFEGGPSLSSVQRVMELSHANLRTVSADTTDFRKQLKAYVFKLAFDIQ